jgi:hypothetical protein
MLSNHQTRNWARYLIKTRRQSQRGNSSASAVGPRTYCGGPAQALAVLREPPQSWLEMLGETAEPGGGAVEVGEGKGRADRMTRGVGVQRYLDGSGQQTAP